MASGSNATQRESYVEPRYRVREPGICWVPPECVDRGEWEFGGKVLQKKHSEGREAAVDIQKQPEGNSSGEIIADHLFCEH